MRSLGLLVRAPEGSDLRSESVLGPVGCTHGLGRLSDWPQVKVDLAQAEGALLAALDLTT